MRTHKNQAHTNTLHSNTREKFRAKVTHVSTTMQELGLPDDLQHRVKAYYEYIWLNREQEGGHIIYNDQDLSMGLRNEVSVAISKSSFPIKLLPAFAKMPDEVMTEVLGMTRIRICMPKDLIFLAGRLEKHFIYNLKGTVCEVSDGGEPRALLGGRFLGEKTLNLESMHTTTAKAATFVELRLLPKLDLYMLLHEHPHLAEMLGEMHGPDGHGTHMGVTRMSVCTDQNKLTSASTNSTQLSSSDSSAGSPRSSSGSSLGPLPTSSKMRRRASISTMDHSKPSYDRRHTSFDVSGGRVRREVTDVDINGNLISILRTMRRQESNIMQVRRTIFVVVANLLTRTC